MLLPLPLVKLPSEGPDAGMEESGRTGVYEAFPGDLYLRRRSILPAGSA